MDSKMRTLVISVIITTILWLLGGFVFDKALGMVCVFIGIALVGWATGNVMNTPEPAHDNDTK